MNGRTCAMKLCSQSSLQLALGSNIAVHAFYINGYNIDTLLDLPIAHHLHQHLKCLLDEQQQLIKGQNLPNIALWRLSQSDILTYLNSLGDPMHLLLPLKEYYVIQPQDADDDIFGDDVSNLINTRMSSGMALQAAGEMMINYEEGNQHLSDCQSDNDSCSSDRAVDLDDEDDRLAADTFTDIQSVFQQVQDSEALINIELPSSLMTGNPVEPVSPHMLWQCSHAVPPDLPPISTLFEVLKLNATGNPPLHSNDFCIWSVAALATAPMEAARVCHSSMK
jgi:hypothetical protein